MKRLRPFFSYFGSKWRMAPKYPAPLYDTIIEPFAGSAQYATLWHDRNVILVEPNEKVCGVWEYLIRVAPQEIAALPSYVEHIDDFPHLPQEAKWLIGFWIGSAGPNPRNRASTWCKSDIRTGFWGQRTKNTLAMQLPYIRHWQIIHDTYDSLCNPFATWFIDPPYNNRAGALYPYNIRCYNQLALWCMNRAGQVIVCENVGSTWLPFEQLAVTQSVSVTTINGRRKLTSEAMYHATNGEKYGQPNRLGQRS